MDRLAEIEQQLFEQKKVVVGVDEAGRGALFGPVVCAAVIMPKQVISGVKDSKLLPPKKRNELYAQIVKNAVKYSVVAIDNEYIDRYNILQAIIKGITDCLTQIDTDNYDVALIDGNMSFDEKYKSHSIIGGDNLCYCIACASILAKVTRDNLMEQAAQKYPQYMLHQHKGYGTKLHYDMLNQYGTTPEHRQTFLKNLVQKHK